MPFLPPNQQRQSAKGKKISIKAVGCKIRNTSTGRFALPRCFGDVWGYLSRFLAVVLIFCFSGPRLVARAPLEHP